MLDIIVLFFLCRKIKSIVEPKGYSGRSWQIRLVLTWLGCEFAGIILSYAFGSSFNIILISGLLCAVLGIIILLQKARSLPDRNTMDDWMDNIGKDKPDEY